MLAQGVDNGGEGAGAPDKAKTDALYENRPASKKIIRVITVMAYMVSVSFVAIVLSGYYVFLWQPPNPRLLHRAPLRADPQIEYRMDDEPGSRSIEYTDHFDLRKEILRNRGINITDRMNVNRESSHVNTNDNLEKSVPLRNKKFSKDPQIFSQTWNQIFQASPETKASKNPNETTPTPVYKSVNNVPITSSVLFIKNDEINESPKNRSTTETSSVRFFKENKYSESSTEKQAANGSILGQIFTNISNLDVDRDGDDSTRDTFETTSTRNHDINYPRIITTEPYETLENYEVSTAINSASGSRSFHELRKDQTSEKMENELKTQSTVQPDELGSHIARVPVTRVATNDSLDEQKHEKNLPGQLPSRNSLVDSSTEDLDTVNELALESSPLIVQSELKFPDEDKVETKEESVSKEMNDFNLLTF